MPPIKLDVEVPHVEEAAAGFAHGGEGGDQKIVERGALRELLAEVHGLPGELFIAHLLHLRRQFVDRRDHRPHGLYFAFVLGSKNLRKNCVEFHNDNLQASSYVLLFMRENGWRGRFQQRSSAR